MDKYQSHPKWQELENICGNIERLQKKAKNLRAKIDKDLFEKSN